MTDNDQNQQDDLAEFITDPLESARAAGLRYVTDTKPGIRRERMGDDWIFIKPNGKPITSPDEIKRIKAIGIPPAYTDVWICPLPNGHIQATGRDAKGRKQYRYHPRWREVRDETKYGRMITFARVLPELRKRVDHDLSLPQLPREKVLATVVRLLETTFIRVGNTEYARDNKSFGLTTMRDRHVTIEGATIHFAFVGKHGVKHEIDIKDRKLAKIVQRCRDIRGYELFQYLDDEGQRVTIDSADVNDYLHEITGEDFTAKDFRTWAGTKIAALTLQSLEPFQDDKEAKKNIVRTIEEVAKRLGNTPTICRKCYVHPAILDAYIDGTMRASLEQQIVEALDEEGDGLDSEERTVLTLLKARLEQGQAQASEPA
ncbi:MAG: DNA topoisomerase IB [Herpetosiphonaceae bacterium]|nr:DNA topoisomerase IB [Herpetosiphonaceae bacterium]